MNSRSSEDELDREIERTERWDGVTPLLGGVSPGKTATADSLERDLVAKGFTLLIGADLSLDTRLGPPDPCPCPDCQQHRASLGTKSNRERADDDR